MKLKQKKQVVKSLGESLSKCQAGVVTSYQGLPTPELVNLRHKLKESGVEFRVVKNTLARKAVAGTDMEFLAPHMDGAIALALGYDDVTAPAKAVTSYIKSAKIEMTIEGGFFTNRWLSEADVNNLAELPPRETLVAMVMAGLQSPIYGLVNALSSPMLGMVWALQARINQIEEK